MMKKTLLTLTGAGAFIRVGAATLGWRSGRIAATNTGTFQVHNLPSVPTERGSVVEKEREAGSAFGALLRRHRLAVGLSQEDLAEQARMSARGIGALERGDRRYPYRETVVLLAKALGLTPAAAAEFAAAAARPRQPRPASSESAAAQDRSPATTPVNNLPLAVTSFIGRETEIAEIAALLGKHRLVTLTGSSGIGKTRTSFEVAANAVDGSDDGIWFIEFAPLSSRPNRRIMAGAACSCKLPRPPRSEKRPCVFGWQGRPGEMALRNHKSKSERKRGRAFRP